MKKAVLFSVCISFLVLYGCSVSNGYLDTWNNKQYFSNNSYPIVVIEKSKDKITFGKYICDYDIKVYSNESTFKHLYGFLGYNGRLIINNPEREDGYSIAYLLGKDLLQYDDKKYFRKDSINLKNIYNIDTLKTNKK
jgi:hypothetical protein